MESLRKDIEEKNAEINVLNSDLSTLREKLEQLASENSTLKLAHEGVSSGQRELQTSLSETSSLTVAHDKIFAVLHIIEEITASLEIQLGESKSKLALCCAENEGT